MSTIADEAIGGLTAALESLLPEVVDPELRPTLLVSPHRIAPTGLGGFVGLNEEPAGEIHGRLVEARVHVTVRAEDGDELPGAVSAVTRALLTPDRAVLAGEGIQRITLDELGPPDGDGPPAARELTFGVLYEFVRLPTAGEGVIESIPLDLDVSLSPREPRRIIRTPFASGSLDWFEVVDDAGAVNNAPSLWAYEPAEERIAQRRRIWGGGTSAASPNKPGTYLVLRAGPRRPPVQDLVLRALVGSDDEFGIGLVYRWQGPDDFHFFLMHASGGYRMLGRKLAGTFQHLETQALDTTQGYTAGSTHRLKLVAVGTHHELSIDGRVALEGDDSRAVAPGRVGFLSHRNEASLFYDIDLTEV